MQSLQDGRLLAKLLADGTEYRENARRFGVGNFEEAFIAPGREGR